MKKLILIPLLALIIGCASFSTNVFRTEQAAVSLVYDTYVAYTNALPMLHLTAQQSNTVKQARLQFAASVAVLEAWRVAYETNAINQPQVEAALQSTLAQSSNFLWLVTYFKTGGK